MSISHSLLPLLLLVLVHAFLCPGLQQLRCRWQPRLPRSIPTPLLLPLLVPRRHPQPSSSYSLPARVPVAVRGGCVCLLPFQLRHRLLPGWRRRRPRVCKKMRAVPAEMTEGLGPTAAHLIAQRRLPFPNPSLLYSFFSAPIPAVFAVLSSQSAQSPCFPAPLTSHHPPKLRPTNRFSSSDCFARKLAFLHQHSVNWPKLPSFTSKMTNFVFFPLSSGPKSKEEKELPSPESAFSQPANNRLPPPLPGDASKPATAKTASCHQPPAQAVCSTERQSPLPPSQPQQKWPPEQVGPGHCCRPQCVPSSCFRSF